MSLVYGSPNSWAFLLTNDSHFHSLIGSLALYSPGWLQQLRCKSHSTPVTNQGVIARPGKRWGRLQSSSLKCRLWVNSTMIHCKNFGKRPNRPPYHNNKKINFKKFFCGTQGLYLEPLHQPFFEIGSCELFARRWLWTGILLISASWVGLQAWDTVPSK
jgi:hypothetical protein